MKNKKILIIGLFLVISIMANGCKQDTSGLVAQVNKVDILEKDYNEELEIQRTIYTKQYGEEFLSQAGPDGQTRDEKLIQDVLDRLIIEELVEQNAKEKKIEVTQEDVDARLDEMKDSIGGEEIYKQFLEENGITEEYFQGNTKKDILMGRYYENYLEETEIKDEDIEKYFEENKEDLVVIRAKHILLNNEEKAKEVLERLKAGEEFEELALTESLDGSAANGGDLGYFKRSDMIKEFSDAAFALDVGATTDLVKTEVGYHIIKLEDKVETLDDLSEQISMMLKQEAYQNHIKDLKDKADIKILLDPEKVASENKVEEEVPEENKNDVKSETKEEDKK